MVEISWWASSVVASNTETLQNHFCVYFLQWTVSPTDTTSTATYTEYTFDINIVVHGDVEYTLSFLRLHLDDFS